jgi:transposase
MGRKSTIFSVVFVTSAVGEFEKSVKQMALHQEARLQMLHLGHKPVEVANMQAVTTPTIYLGINRWRSGGLDELANKPRSGRPL